jgi:hypothetical protein
VRTIQDRLRLLRAGGVTRLDHQHLQTIIRLRKVDQIQDWCSELVEISRALAEAIDGQQKI